MCPDVMKNLPASRKAQVGFLMPLAIFILVAMSFFAITISRVTGQTAIATTQEAISVASFYAADSAAQYAMNQLFYNNAVAISRATVDASCTAVNGDALTFTVSGLNGCSAVVSCARSIDAANTTSYYRIQGQSSCGSGSISAQRIVEVSAYMK